MGSLLKPSKFSAAPPVAHFCIGADSAELLSVDVRFAEEPTSDEELLAAVAKAIKDCLPISCAPPPKLARGRPAPGLQVPELTAEERKQFLAAIYSPRHIDDGP